MEDSIKGTKRVLLRLLETRKLGQCAWKPGTVRECNHGMVSVYTCVLVFVECVCVCVTVALQDKAEGGLEPSEQIKDELEKERR